MHRRAARREPRQGAQLSVDDQVLRSELRQVQDLQMLGAGCTWSLVVAGTLAVSSGLWGHAGGFLGWSQLPGAWELLAVPGASALLTRCEVGVRIGASYGRSAVMAIIEGVINHRLEAMCL